MPPGIPDRSDKGDISNLSPDKVLTIVRQLHEADRAGTHQDFRIGDKKGLISWAIRHGLPEDKPRLAVRQPVHSFSYKDFQGSIPEGYGKGLVSLIQQVPAAVLSNTGDKITFVKGDSKHAPIYTLVNTGKDWLAIKNKPDNPPQVLSYQKQHFKSIPAAKLLALASSPKIDGSGALVKILKDKLAVYSIRKDKEGNAIPYTDLIGGLRDKDIPKELVGKLIRAQVGGTKDGRIAQPNQISAILNSSVVNAIKKKHQRNIKLKLYLLSQIKNNQQDWSSRQNMKDIADKLKDLPVESIPQYTPQEAQQQLQLMREGKHPLTQQGLVYYSQEGPVKAKLMNDYDVVLRKIFQADSQNKRAGGFSYSLPQEQDIKGNVGSGFTHAQLKDMLLHPQDYIGRTARISAQGQYPSGAYRAPKFIAFKED